MTIKLLFIAIIGAIIYLLTKNFPAISSDDKIHLVQSALILSLFSSSIILHFRSNPGDFIRNIAAWLGIFCVLIIAYSFRYDLINLKNRLAGELSPSSATPHNDGSLSFRISSDNHFHINATINRTPVKFLLDTGASDITLTLNDAKRTGYDIKNLAFTKIYNTANGQTYGAPIIIKTLKIGDLTMHNLSASVNSGQMDQSLLGMVFLDKLTGYEVKEGILTLRP